MKTVRAFLALLVLFVAACTASGPQTVRPDRLAFVPLEFNVPEIEPVVLENGIRVYLFEDPELPLVELTAMVGAGSIHDPAGKVGQGGLFAGLLQKGGAGERTPREFEEFLESLAIDFGVSTDAYMTTVDLSLLQEDVDAGLAILDDVLRRPRFDAERLELLRKQTLEGIRRRDDDPDSVAGRALDRAIYADHPLGREATTETVSAIGREDLIGFHRQQFAPDNLWLAISGDFDRQAMLERVTAMFAGWRPAGYRPLPLPELPQSLPPAVWLGEKDIPQTTIRLGHLGVSKDNPDLQAVRVMNFILGGGGFNSRLLREIRSNRGLAYSTYSYFMVGRRLPGAFVAGSETKSASTMEVVRLMLAEMERIRTEPVGEEELSLARESLVNSFVFAFADSHQVLTQQMRLDFFDYPKAYLRTYRDKIAALTRQDILRAAQTYLHPEKLAIVLVGRSADFDAPPDSLGLPVKEIPLRQSADGARSE